MKYLIYRIELHKNIIRDMYLFDFICPMIKRKVQCWPLVIVMAVSVLIKYCLTRIDFVSNETTY